MALHFPSILSLRFSFLFSPRSEHKKFTSHLLKDINLNSIRNYEIKNRLSFREGDANRRFGFQSLDVDITPRKNRRRTFLYTNSISITDFFENIIKIKLQH